MELRSKTLLAPTDDPPSRSTRGRQNKSNQKNTLSEVMVKTKKSELEQPPKEETAVSIGIETSPSAAKDMTLARVNELVETWSSFKCRQPQHSQFFDQLSQIMRSYGNYIKDSGSLAQTMLKTPKVAETGESKIVTINYPTIILRLPLSSDGNSMQSKKLKSGAFASCSQQVSVDGKSIEHARRWKAEREKILAIRILIEKVMSNYLLAEMIFQHLPVKDLLSCIKVNRTWFPHARQILKRDRKCFAKVDFRNTCRRLRAFKLLIENSVAVPFNGITIDYSCYSCRSYRNVPLNSPLNASTLFLDPEKITIKYLKILNWRVNSHCPIFYLIRTIFLNHASTLQEITVRLITSENYQPITGLTGMLTLPSNVSETTSPIVVHPNLFPQLKELTVPEGQLTSFVQVVNDFILGAPKLEKIINKVYLNTIHSLVVNKKAHIIKKFCFMPLRGEDLTLAYSFAQQALQIEEITMSSASSFNFSSFGSVFSVLRMLYTSCQNTLKRLDLTQVDLLLLAGFTMPTLPRVKEIHLHCNLRLDNLLGYRSLSKVNYGVTLPNLQSLLVDRLDPLSLINGSRHWPGEFRGWWQNASEFTCSSVSRIRFELQPTLGTYGEDHLVERRMLESFPAIFNCVVHLHLHRPTDFPYIFTHLWTSWPMVESITMTGIEDNDLWKNFDAAFTGISDENCNMIRDSNNYDNFKELQVQPNITWLKKLKLLRLHIHHQKCEDESYSDESSRHIFLTQVTGKCAFAEMPSLKVEISRVSCHFRLFDKRCSLLLDCLKPFVKFVRYAFDYPNEWESDKLD